MKVVVRIRNNESADTYFSLDEDSLMISKNNDELKIECSYKDRFNSLISLFACKNEWEKEDKENCLYNVLFENKGNKELYCFDEIPSNWHMFMGYFVRLVGDL